MAADSPARGSRSASPRPDARHAGYAAAMAAEPAVKFHFYGKSSRPGRKVGHVTATGDDRDQALARARAAAGFFQN